MKYFFFTYILFIFHNVIVIQATVNCIPPTIETNGPRSASLGSLVILKCNAKGYPKPEITWYRNQTKLVTSEHYLILDETLEIIGAKVSDSGLYICNANNNIHKPKTAIIAVNILQASYKIEPKFRTAKKQKDKNREYIKQCIFGKPCIIYCHAYGWPTPEIRWMYGAKILKNNTDTEYDFTLENSLIIRNFTLLSIGTYTCQAKLNGIFDKNYSRSIAVFNNHKKNTIIRNKIEPNIQCKILAESTLEEVKAVATKLANNSEHNMIMKDLPQVSNALYAVLNLSNPIDDEKEEDFKSMRSILKSVHKILDNLDLSTKENGTTKYVTPYTAILVTDSNRSDVIGMMTLTSDPMTLSDARPIHFGVNDKEEALANTVVKIKGNNLNIDIIHKLSFTVFANTRAFIQLDENVKTVVSHVVGVSAPEKEAAMLTSVEVELKPLTPNLRPGQTRRCAYWELEIGEWSTEGCKLLRHDETTGRDVCECQRLAHFGLILGVEGVSPILHNISLAGCILSILGLLGIAITAAVFPKWRSQLGNKILLHLSLSIGLIMCTFLSIAFGATHGGNKSFGCITVGVILHYSILASFFWMLVTAILQFFRLVIVFATRPARFLMKGSIFGWGVPIIPVIVLLTIGPQKSYRSYDNNIAFCYPQGLSLVLSLVTPVALVVTVNFIVFSIIIYKVTCGRESSIMVNANEATDKKLLIAQLKMSILLFFLLGLTWVFGLLAMISPKYEELKILFIYLFCILATMQGFIMFLYFIVLDKKARGFWINLLIKKLDKPVEDSSTVYSTTVSDIVTFLRRVDGNNSNKTETSTL